MRAATLNQRGRLVGQLPRQVVWEFSIGVPEGGGHGQTDTPNANHSMNWYVFSIQRDMGYISPRDALQSDDTNNQRQQNNTQNR